jgi:phosphatidylserine/phosphatidylglycerophosphate/cardiolipin synthase-like enzyme
VCFHMLVLICIRIKVFQIMVDLFILSPYNTFRYNFNTLFWENLDGDMKDIIRLTVLLTVALWIVLSPPISLSQEAPPTWQVYFSPHGGCTDAIVKELNKAQKTVFLQAYSFTSAPIAKALLNAHKRGVKVEVILDKSQRTEKYSSATFFFNAGIPVKIDAQHAIAHNKVMVIDGETVITGSFNFTKAAEEKNTENLLVIRDNKLAERYIKNWQEHAGNSEVYVGREK